MISLNVPNVLTIALIAIVAHALLKMVGGMAAKKPAAAPVNRRAS